MLELIQKAKAARPLGTLELYGEMPHRAGMQARDENGHTWLTMDVITRCEVCASGCPDGWLHAGTSAEVCSDCVEFPEYSIGEINDHQAAEIFAAISARDTAEVQRLMDAVVRAQFGSLIH